MGTQTRVHGGARGTEKPRGKEPAAAAFGVKIYRTCVWECVMVQMCHPRFPVIRSFCFPLKKNSLMRSLFHACAWKWEAVIWPPTSPCSHTHARLFSAQAERWGFSLERLFWLARLLYVRRKCVPPRQFSPFKWEVRLNLVVVEVVGVNTLDRLNN